MDSIKKRPELIIIAGPNGSGKTTITQKFLHHEWSEGTLYINPDQVAKDMFGDWNDTNAIIKAATPFIDRLYVYDNSIENQDTRLLFRTYDGKLVKQYSKEIPEWAFGIYT